MFMKQPQRHVVAWGGGGRMGSGGAGWACRAGRLGGQAGHIAETCWTCGGVGSACDGGRLGLGGRLTMYSMWWRQAGNVEDACWARRGMTLVMVLAGSACDGFRLEMWGCMLSMWCGQARHVIEAGWDWLYGRLGSGNVGGGHAGHVEGACWLAMWCGQARHLMEADWNWGHAGHAAEKYWTWTLDRLGI
jgi:hypothetical protein